MLYFFKQNTFFKNFINTQNYNQQKSYIFWASKILKILETFINNNSNDINIFSFFINIININNKEGLMTVKFIGKAKITKQGQVTLPFEAREELKLDLNSEVYWYLVDDHLVVVKDLVSVDELINKINKQKKSNKKIKG